MLVERPDLAFYEGLRLSVKSLPNDDSRWGDHMKSKFFLALLIFAGQGLWASVNNVSSLNQTLQKTRAGWVARDNWVNQLPRDQVRRMLGLRGTPPADVQFSVPESLQVRARGPVVLDWRLKDGKNWVSPILNQANCGSCVAFAAVGVMETQLNIAAVLPNLNVRLSPQNLFACGGGMCDFGWWPTSAANFLQQTGVPDEACMPYLSGATGNDVSCNAACADIGPRRRKISSYAMPTRSAKDIEAVKQALQAGPVMTTLGVYADFISYGGGVYKHTSGEMLGGHAVSIVGYDDTLQAFIIRNSWGESWGERGFAHIAYSDTSGIGDSTWKFEIPAAGGVVSVLSPRDYDYVGEKVDFKVQSTFGATDTLAVSVYDKSGKSVWNSNCTPSSVAATCVGSLESNHLADGRYEVEAIAMNQRGEKIGTSSRQFFYVLNSKPSLNLSFKGKGIDLNSDLSGRIEFDINTLASPVPMSSLEFHFRGPDGKDNVRVAEVVLPSMSMGWRTNTVPDGKYEIWMVGKVKTSTSESSVSTPALTVHLKN